ncbi:P22 phage major capsid protein family protein [Aurantiacibacter spongiae]|uniref:Coat protein n=1 Tax=Aurantiacibacter spongiae TaxID=2488860 RepID=A0A3N5CSY1_9SPHN|nr:P22 phage major capsid protein family protein [Aurantiacibacter spongiae]RPF70450.1 hypothetical protein EG799_01505 [Aurantiacibacter spongiae]
MANSFTKQELVMFDDMIEGFDDQLVIAKGAETYQPEDPEAMARAGDQFWVPAPMISASYDGFDQTSNFGDTTELSVPVSIGYHKSVAVKYSAKELRIKSALEKKGKSAKQKLGSDVNLALFNTVALQGSMFVKRTGAPTGFDDVALADALMTERGISQSDRLMFLAPRVANAMAGNLANRATDNSRDLDAYSRAMIGSDVAGFELFKNDQSVRLAAAGGGATTVNGATQRTVPAATTTAATGEKANKDNRYTDLVITAANYAAIDTGDAFTIAGVNSLHMITKQDTGQLMTFRVVGKPAANTIRVYPAIIDAAEGSTGSKEYANVSATPANGAAITWLNTTAAELNPFFKRESLLLIPGSYSVDPQDGWQVRTATTDLGIRITYARQGEINDLSVKARWDIDFGASLIAPEMAGNMAFNQA